MQIIIRETEKPRYDTCGDWFFEGETLIIETTLRLQSREGMLVAIHELVEWMLCKDRGITQEAVDAFDMAFKGEGEPGDDPKAPYRLEHRQAMLVEHLLANFLGLPNYGKVE